MLPPHNLGDKRSFAKGMKNVPSGKGPPPLFDNVIFSLLRPFIFEDQRSPCDIGQVCGDL